MTVVQRLVRLTLALFVAVVLSAGIAHVLGANLVIYNDWKPPFFIEYVTFMALFIVGTIFEKGFIFNRDWKFLKKPLIAYSGFSVFANAILPHIVYAIVIPAIMLVVMIGIKREYKNNITNSIMWFVVIIPFQAIMVWARTEIGFMWHPDMSFVPAVAIAIDGIIVSSCIYFIGGVTNEKNACSVKVAIADQDCDLRSFGQRVECLRKSYSFSQIYGTLKSAIKTKSWQNRGFARLCVIYALQVFQIAVILLLAYAGGVLLESSIILTSFMIYSAIIKKRWHSSSFWYCTGIAAAIFYFLGRGVPPFRYSWFISVIMGFGVVYVCYLVECRLEKARSDRTYRKRMEKLLEFSLNYEKRKEDKYYHRDDEATIREIAQYKQISQHDIELIVLYYCRSLSCREIATKEPYRGTYSTINSRILKLNEAFNAPLDIEPVD